MITNKPSRFPEVNDSKNPTDKHKVKSPQTKRYTGNNNWTKTLGQELEYKTDFKGTCSNLEDYIFDLGPKSLEKFPQDDEGYGALYWDNLQ